MHCLEIWSHRRSIEAPGTDAGRSSGSFHSRLRTGISAPEERPKHRVRAYGTKLTSNLWRLRSMVDSIHQVTDARLLL